MTLGVALDNGFDEVCAIVHDIADSATRLCALFGYRRLWHGVASPGALELLGLPAGATGLEVLLGDPAQGRGNIRLFSILGNPTRVMRDGAQPWDTGGIFDINIRALGSIEGLHLAMTRMGFCAFAPITAWDFGPFSVKEVVSRDGDGLAIALMERVAPPLQGYAHVTGHASYVFNSTQIVPSFDAARAFYVDVLGWKPVQESQWAHENGLNCMGLPLDVARSRLLRVGIYQSNGLMEGSVEVIEFAGESMDFSYAAPPARGWAALRLPMTDVAGFLDRAARSGCTILPLRTVEMQPYRQVDAAAAITPWGVRLEVYRLARASA